MLRLLCCKKKGTDVLTGSKRFNLRLSFECTGLWSKPQGQRKRPGGGQRLTQGLRHDAACAAGAAPRGGGPCCACCPHRRRRHQKKARRFGAFTGGPSSSYRRPISIMGVERRDSRSLRLKAGGEGLIDFLESTASAQAKKGLRRRFLRVLRRCFSH